MPRLSENYSMREKKEGRCFTCIVYPDSSSYDCELIINRLNSFWDKWYYIYHDKDTYTEQDLDKYVVENKGNYPDWKIGDQKKPHYHIIGFNSSPCMLGRAAKKFGIESNLVQPVHKLKEMVQYLIHLNNPNKYQYNEEEIITNDNEISTILRKSVSAEEKADELLDFILTSDVCTMTSLAQFAVKNHLWDELRRGQHIYGLLIKEKFEELERIKREAQYKLMKENEKNGDSIHYEN